MEQFTPLSVEPTLVKLMSWDEIEATYGSPEVEEEEEESTQGFVKRNVFTTEDYAIKIIGSEDEHLSNELHVAEQLNQLSGTTEIFAFTHGYVLSLDLPPDVKLTDKKDHHHYVYSFMEKITDKFDMLCDEPQDNEDFFFEILIGLYYARKKFKFVHNDLHAGNLMVNVRAAPTTRTHLIDNFTITIENTMYDPKLIDYGRSVIAKDYTDDKWAEPRYKYMTFKSDIYYLAAVFIQRKNLSVKFRTFLEEHVIRPFQDSRLAFKGDLRGAHGKPEKDSGANYKNIENLLVLYFGRNQKAKCMVCADAAKYRIGKSLFFCGESCKVEFIKTK